MEYFQKLDCLLEDVRGCEVVRGRYLNTKTGERLTVTSVDDEGGCIVDSLVMRPRFMWGYEIVSLGFSRVVSDELSSDLNIDDLVSIAGHMGTTSETGNALVKELHNDDFIAEFERRVIANEDNILRSFLAIINNRSTYRTINCPTMADQIRFDDFVAGAKC